MHQVFTTTVRIRFAHCDPAGLVFHPHFFTIFNGVVEDFFRDVVGEPFHSFIDRGVGLPVAGVHCDFVEPCRAGDVCEARLWVERIGRSSIRFAMTLTCEGRLRVKLAETTVCVDRNAGFRPQALPEELRSRLLPYLVDAGTTPLVLRS